MGADVIRTVFGYILQQALNRSMLVLSDMRGSIFQNFGLRDALEARCGRSGVSNSHGGVAYDFKTVHSVQSPKFTKQYMLV